MAQASFNTVRHLVLSLLNGAGWTTVLDANISSATAALTTTASVFASTDVGKTVYILGAGSAGATLSTLITAYTSPTQVTLGANAGTNVFSAVASFGGDMDDDRRNVLELDETISTIDLEVTRTILETPSHPRWTNYTRSGPVTVATSGLPLVDHMGPLLKVTRTRTDNATVPAELVPYKVLAGWSRNNGTQYPSTLKEDFYAIEEDHIYFSGGGTVEYSYFNITKSGTLQSPDDFTVTIVRGALGVLLAKEGDSVEAAGYYQRMYREDLGAIRGGNTTVPPMVRQDGRG